MNVASFPQAPVATPLSAVPASTDSQRVNQVVDGKYSDYRWANGSWDLESSAFKGKDGKVDWDLVRRPFPVGGIPMLQLIGRK